MSLQNEGLLALTMAASGVDRTDVVIGILGALGSIAGVTVLIKLTSYFRERRGAKALGSAMPQHGSASKNAPEAIAPSPHVAPKAPQGSASSISKKEAAKALNPRFAEALKALRTSHLGDKRGREALYDLPWYLLIGNSSAGKTSAVTQAGLRFPLDDGKFRAVKGEGGTRDCDWYFTSEGILLDTAGRYAGDPSQHDAWLAFLGLLRKYRRRAPINGLIVAVSIDDIATAGRAADEDAVVALATTFRKRLHEISEHLAISVPVYVMFTKADRIPGFSDYFGDMDEVGRRQVWGATLPFDADGTGNAASQFGEHLDALVTRLRRGTHERIAAGLADLTLDLHTLPNELAARKSPMARFVEVLFESTPYHGRPVFRGFYLSSAMPAASPESVDRKAFETTFALAASPLREPPAGFAEGGSFFLHDVFRSVVFADKALVAQRLPRKARRRRRVALWAACLAAGVALGWLSYGYRNATRLVREVEADYAQVERLMAERVDLQGRLDALLILQARVEQLVAYRDNTPWWLWPAYDDEALLGAVRQQYFAGIRSVMIEPAAAELARYLEAAVSGKAQAGSTGVAGSPYAGPAANDRQATYAALKAYLMLADPKRVESTHLAAEITRFWRGWLEANRGDMTREAMIDRADRLVRFHAGLSGEPKWPNIQPRAALVDDTRRLLGEAMRGTPARDRVFADIVSRASARYPAVTVRDTSDPGASVLAGSHAIPGAYSLAAWQGYVREAIGDASRKALDTSDWVLGSRHVDDLTLSASPEHVRNDLEQEYARRYIAEWQQFLAGVTVAPFTDFAGAVDAIDRLGDAERSPLKTLLQRARRETSWDELPVPANADAKAAAVASATRGPVSQAFAGLARLVDARDGSPSPVDSYLVELGKLRSRLHAIANEGDVGPGARRFLEATLQGKESELVSALRHTDEHMLTGLADAQRSALRPLLLRPLVQTFAALVEPVELELNRVWEAQVLAPFRDDLARKFPFDEGGRVEATPDDIARVFGPAGAIARFASDTLGPLVERRGDILTPRRWGEQSVALKPELLAGFPRWVSTDGSAANGQHTVFQLMPEPTGAGISEVAIGIAGQGIRFRNEPPQWSNFVWGGAQSNAARIDATTSDGRLVTVAEFSGANALGELVSAARRERADDGTHVLTWTRDGTTVSVRLRIVTAARVDAEGNGKRGLRGVELPARIAGDMAVAEIAP